MENTGNLFVRWKIPFKKGKVITERVSGQAKLRGYVLIGILFVFWIINKEDTGSI
jgi:hypothetical protein